MSKIFEEALADAKKLKAVAEENAQKAILESVTPQIKQFIEQTLLEQDETENEELSYEEASEEHDESVVLDESAIISLVEMLGAENIYKNIKEKNTINESFGKALNNLTEKDRLRMTQLIKKINHNKIILNNDDIINDQTNSVKESMNMRNREKMYEVDLGLLRESVNDRMYELADQEDDKLAEDDTFNDISMEEMSDMYSEAEEEHSASELDSEEGMIAELSRLLEQEDEESAEELASEGEADMIPRDEIEAQIEELIADLGLDIGGGGAPAGEADLGALEDIDLDEEPAEELESEEDSEEELNEVFDIDPEILKEEIRNIKRMITEGNVDHHFGGKGDTKAGVDGSYGGKGPKKTGHQKSFGGGAYGKDPFVNPPSSLKKLNEAIRQLSRKNRAQKEKLSKYRGAVETLREQLEDLNLFNAKLLYVNKLLQNKYLNESQKKSVIKALDEAKTLTETKALYKSLTESLGRSKTLNESKKFGSSSRATTSGSGHKNKTVGESVRWAKLAGLK